MQKIANLFQFNPEIIILSSSMSNKMHVNIIFPLLNTSLDNNFFHREIVNFVLPLIFSISFGCSKEPSH